MLVRLQLALPEGLPGQAQQPPQTIFNGELYNQIFTIHASVMIFLFIIPFGIGGFGNYLVR